MQEGIGRKNLRGALGGGDTVFSDYGVTPELVKKRPIPLLSPVAGAWDSLSIRWPILVKHPETRQYHIIFVGAASDEVGHIGIADAETDDPLGTYAEYSGNPIASPTPATEDEHGLGHPSVIFRQDLDPPIWRIYYSGIQVIGAVHYENIMRLSSAGSDIHGPYTKDGVMIARGGAGTYDELEASRPSVLNLGNTGYECIYSARDAADVLTLARATATAAEVWTKDQVIMRGKYRSWDRNIAGHQLLSYGAQDILVYTGTAGADNSRRCHHFGLAFSSDMNRRIWGKPPQPFPLQYDRWIDVKNLWWMASAFEPYIFTEEKDASIIFIQWMQGTGGTYGMLTAQPSQVFGARCSRELLTPHHYPQLEYPLWYDETVDIAGESTPFVEVSGFPKKTFYLYSPLQDGVANIQVDIDGICDAAGGIIWRDLASVAVTAATLCPIHTEMNFHRARLFFNPAAGATGCYAQLVVGR